MLSLTVNHKTILNIRGGIIYKSKPILKKEGQGKIVTWEDDERYKDVTMKFHHFLDDRGYPRPELKLEVTGRP